MESRWIAVVVAWAATGGTLTACAFAWGPEHIAAVIGLAVFMSILATLISLLTLIAEAEMGKKAQPADRADAGDVTA